MTTLDRAIGVMIGAAYGDSLGAQVEISKQSEIFLKYGPSGITVPQPFKGFKQNQGVIFPAGSITDDTQMAMCVAQGICESDDIWNYEYIQEKIWGKFISWELSQSDPKQRRGPGKTCLDSIKNGIMGSLSEPINTSAGCGGVMRAHPIGIVYDDRDVAFYVSARIAAMTHGSPMAYLPAATLSFVISSLLGEADFKTSLLRVHAKLEHSKSKEVLDSFETAINASIDEPLTVIEKTVGHVSTPRGGGWLGHDALAIAVYANLCFAIDPIQAIWLSVNHSGDSDSTGCVAGAIAGAIHGYEPFLNELSANKIKLEHSDELIELAKQLSRKRLIAF